MTSAAVSKDILTSTEEDQERESTAVWQFDNPQLKVNGVVSFKLFITLFKA